MLTALENINIFHSRPLLSFICPVTDERLCYYNFKISEQMQIWQHLCDWERVTTMACALLQDLSVFLYEVALLYKVI
jgi:hypothetical protein